MEHACCMQITSTRHSKRLLGLQKQEPFSMWYATRKCSYFVYDAVIKTFKLCFCHSIYCNKFHINDNHSLSLGSWSSPSVKGSRPSPCTGFSLTMIDEEHAVMFGGSSPDSDYLADVYVLHLPTMVSGLLIHITLIVCLSAVVPVVNAVSYPRQ